MDISATTNQVITNENKVSVQIGKQKIFREMPIMTDSKFFVERIESQIEWYNRKSSTNQKRYRLFKRIEIILAASIPVVISLSAMEGMNKYHIDRVFQVSAAIAGLVLAIINNVASMEEYFKNWKNYRSTCEALQHEKFKYLTCAEPYDDVDAYSNLVDKIEAILLNENQKWKQVPKTKQAENQEKEIEEKKDNAKLIEQQKENNEDETHNTVQG